MRLTQWKQRLLDLGKRNRLLYFKPTKRTTLQLTHPQVNRIFDRLVRQELPLQFYQPPEVMLDAEAEADESGTALSAELPKVSPNELLTDKPPKQLLVSLNQLRLRARTAVEEQGVNILYVAFGLLEWAESDSSQNLVRSPLILVPVALQQKSLLDPCRLVPYDDDVVLNPTLAYKLERDFGITLPNLPDDADNWSLDAYLADVEERVRPKLWRVIREAQLGLFSFLKLNMYRDLEENAGAMADHPIIAALAGDTSRLAPLPADLPEPEELDARVSPHDTFQVVDADSSQQRAILMAKRGVNFVLQGPPGTGKSQTITNIIAECLGAGKRVLFVAEKMAALDVVYRRLEESGLAEHCLKLHSRSANKKEVIAELVKTLDAAVVRPPDRVDERLDKLVALRQELNTFVREMHLARQPTGWTVYQIHGEAAERSGAPDLSFPLPGAGRLPLAEIRRLELLAEQLASTLVRLPSDYDSNPWRECIAPESTYELRHDIQTYFDRLLAVVQEESERLVRLTERLGLEPPQTLGQLKRTTELLALAGESPSPPAEWFTTDSVQPLVEQAGTYAAMLSDYHARRSSLLQGYRESVLAVDPQPLLTALHTDGPELLGHLAGHFAAGLDAVLAERDRLAVVLEPVAPVCERLLAATAGQAVAVGLPGPETLEQAESLLRLCELMAQDLRPQLEWFVPGRLRLVHALFQEARQAYSDLQADERQLFELYDRSVLDLDIAAMLARFRTQYTSIFRCLRPGYYADMRALRAQRQRADGFGFAAAQHDLALMRRIQERRDWVAQHEAELSLTFGTWFFGRESEWGRIAGALTSTEAIINWFQPDSVPPDIQSLLLDASRLRSALLPMHALRQAVEQAQPVLAALEPHLRVQAPPPGSADLSTVSLQAVGEAAMIALKALRRVTGSIDAVAAHARVPAYRPALLVMGDLEQVTYVQTTEAQIAAETARLQAYFGRLYDGLETDWQQVLQSLEWAGAVRSCFKHGRLPDRLIQVLCNDPTGAAELRTIAKWCGEQIEQAEAAAAFVRSLFRPEFRDLDNLQFSALCDWLGACLNDLAGLEQWIDFRSSRERLEQAGLGAFVTEAVANRVSATDVKAGFYKRFYRLWLDDVCRAVPELQGFRSSRFEERIQEFRNLDQAQFKLAQARLRAQLSERRPQQQGIVSRRSEPWTLRREAEKRRRQKPLRKLFAEIPELLLTLKPCLLMSPLSVSQLLAAGLLRFDVVIFDEASQVLPEDAIGAIFRGDQLIVVGDREQLPPTSFFTVGISDSTWDDDEEQDETDAFDSILEECGAVLHRSDLRWHYRSRHEHLIAFSNAEIYGNLVTFPGASQEGADQGLQFVHVPNGVYDRSGSRTNRVEAKRVADLVFEHFRRHPNRSLGVVTFSQAQQDAVDMQLRQMRLANPELEPFFREEGEEPFFIKNLENVQGDERDTIILSVGYGKDPSGVLHMNFGPLNSTNGYRRLNVAITRAKYNLKLVSSIRPGDIDPNRTTARGVHMLRSYLDFALHGPAVLQDKLPAGKAGGFDSPFEEAVYRELVRNGYTVDTQVGCSGYRIDLAVRRSPQVTDYVLGIECDGRSYHSAKTARDRDRLREARLRDRGWRIHRIWSTDWIKDPAGQTRRLLAAIEDAMAQAAPVVEPFPSMSDSERPTIVEPSPELELGVEDLAGQQVADPPAGPAGILPGAVPYAEADIWCVPREGVRDPLQYLGHVISYVVSIESPIHTEVLLRRLMPLWGKGRVSRGLRQQVESIAARTHQGRYVVRGDFYWMAGMTVPPVRVPAPDEKPRDIEHICEEEMAEAMALVLLRDLGVTTEDLLTETARALGYNRTGHQVRAALLGALHALVDAGSVEVVADRARLKR